MRTAKVKASLSIRAVSPEPPLLAHKAMSREEPSDRKPDPWPLWMAGHEQLKFFHDGMLEDTNSLDAAHMRALV